MRESWENMQCPCGQVSYGPGGIRASRGLLDAAECERPIIKRSQFNINAPHTSLPFMHWRKANHFALGAQFVAERPQSIIMAMPTAIKEVQWGACPSRKLMLRMYRVAKLFKANANRNQSSAKWKSTFQIHGPSTESWRSTNWLPGGRRGVGASSRCKTESRKQLAQLAHTFSRENISRTERLRATWSYEMLEMLEAGLNWHIVAYKFKLLLLSFENKAQGRVVQLQLQESS